MQTRGGKSGRGGAKSTTKRGRSKGGVKTRRVTEEGDPPTGLEQANSGGRFHGGVLRIHEEGSAADRANVVDVVNSGSLRHSKGKGLPSGGPSRSIGGQGPITEGADASKRQGSGGGGPSRPGGGLGPTTEGGDASKRQGSGGGGSSRSGGGQGPTTGGGATSKGQGSSGARGMSSYSSNHSSQATVSRTSFPTQYAASKQSQTSQQLPNTQPARRLSPQQQHPEYQPDEEEFHHTLYRDQQLEGHPHQFSGSQDHLYEGEESEDEDDDEDDEMEEAVLTGQQQHYDQLLEDLMALPGRGHLPCLSQQPIPNRETTW